MRPWTVVKASLSALVATGVLAFAGLAGGPALAADVSVKLGHVGADISPQQTIAKMFSDSYNFV